MGKNNRARRAAKIRQRERHERARAGDHSTGHGRERGSRDDADHRRDQRIDERTYVSGIVDLAAQRLVAAGDVGIANVAVARLAECRVELVDDALGSELRRSVVLAWRNGWQPVEFVRQGRRRGNSIVESVLLAAVVADHATRRTASLDPRWLDQARSLGASLPDGNQASDVPEDRAAAGAWFRSWATQQGNGLAAGTVPDRERRVQVIRAAVEAIALVRGLPRIEELIPPPGISRGGERARNQPLDIGEAERQMLERVRNLLAKAESTAFEAEAEAFTAKAHELITRHAIDTALLHSEAQVADEDPISIRVPIDDPYADAKSLLLQIIAGANRCRAVYSSAISMSTVLGFPADVSATQLLFASLLVQAQTALVEAGRHAPPGTRTRRASYRSAFLLAYSQRIGQRLDEINAHLIAEAGDRARLLPALRSRTDAVDAAFQATFPNLTSGRVRSGSDAAGWAGGRMAADRAQLSFADIGSRPGSSGATPEALSA